jgi:hypothetical protein
MRYKTKPVLYKPTNVEVLNINKVTKGILLRSKLKPGDMLYNFEAYITYESTESSYYIDDTDDIFRLFTLELYGQVKFTDKHKLFDKYNTIVTYDAYTLNLLSLKKSDRNVSGQTKISDIEAMLYTKEELVTNIVKKYIIPVYVGEEYK